jgi:HrpA-like RNA helicase
MGRLLSKLPTDVHLGKFLLIATLFRCLDPALTIAAALNSKSPFLSPFGHEQEADRAKLSFRVGMLCVGPLAPRVLQRFRRELGLSYDSQCICQLASCICKLGLCQKVL